MHACSFDLALCRRQPCALVIPPILECPFSRAQMNPQSFTPKVEMTPPRPVEVRKHILRAPAFRRETRLVYYKQLPMKGFFFGEERDEIIQNEILSEPAISTIAFGPLFFSTIECLQLFIITS